MEKHLSGSSVTTNSVKNYGVNSDMTPHVKAEHHSLTRLEEVLIRIYHFLGLS